MTVTRADLDIDHTETSNKEGLSSNTPNILSPVVYSAPPEDKSMRSLWCYLETSLNYLLLWHKDDTHTQNCIFNLISKIPNLFLRLQWIHHFLLRCFDFSAHSWTQHSSPALCVCLCACGLHACVCVCDFSWKQSLCSAELGFYLPAVSDLRRFRPAGGAV